MPNTPFSSTEQSRISRLLAKKLHPEFLSSRPGFNNTRLTYVEGWQIIDLANRIFGFNGWSSELKSFDTQIDIINDKFTIIVSCIARVTLKDGSYKEDTGSGSAENQRSKCVAMEKARKEAATDALKRALRQFGSALGNCCYDKNYLKSLSKNEVVRGREVMSKGELEGGESIVFEDEEFSKDV